MLMKFLAFSKFQLLAITKYGKNNLKLSFHRVANISKSAPQQFIHPSYLRLKIPLIRNPSCQF